jgi:hypothetical protein
MDLSKIRSRLGEDKAILEVFRENEYLESLFSVLEPLECLEQTPSYANRSYSLTVYME